MLRQLPQLGQQKAFVEFRHRDRARFAALRPQLHAVHQELHIARSGLLDDGARPAGIRLVSLGLDHDAVVRAIVEQSHVAQAILIGAQHNHAHAAVPVVLFQHGRAVVIPCEQRDPSTFDGRAVWIRNRHQASGFLLEQPHALQRRAELVVLFQRQFAILLHDEPARAQRIRQIEKARVVRQQEQRAE